MADFVIQIKGVNLTRERPVVSRHFMQTPAHALYFTTGRLLQRSQSNARRVGLFRNKNGERLKPTGKRDFGTRDKGAELAPQTQQALGGDRARAAAAAESELFATGRAEGYHPVEFF
jgi:hypothetical protein